MRFFCFFVFYKPANQNFPACGRLRGVSILGNIFKQLRIFAFQFTNITKRGMERGHKEKQNQKKYSLKRQGAVCLVRLKTD